MKSPRYSVFLALNDISDKAILEAELAPVGVAIPPRPAAPSGQFDDTRKGKRAGVLLPFAGWIAAALGIVLAAGIMVALIRGGVLVNPFGPPPDTDTDTSTEQTTDEPAEELVFEVWDGTVATHFANGQGTRADPYIINKPAQLAYLAKQLKVKNSSYATKYYRLEANLDMRRFEWTPIGTGNSAFSGHFDGNGHVIRNLSFSKFTSAKGYNVAGLFGVVKNATIQNLTVTDVTFYIKNPDPSYEKLYTGGLAGIILVGQEKTVTLTNCKLARIKISVVCTDSYYPNNYQGGVVGRISIEEDGQFKGERIQAVDVDLFGKYGNDLYQGIFTGYTECRAALFKIKDVCLEGTAGHPYIGDRLYYAAVSGKFYIDGGNADCRNIFAVCDSPSGTGYIFSSHFYPDQFSNPTFLFENCFMGHTNVSSPKPADNYPFILRGEETSVTYRNCLYTNVLPEEHWFQERVWDVSDPRHPRLR